MNMNSEKHPREELEALRDGGASDRNLAMKFVDTSARDCSARHQAPPRPWGRGIRARGQAGPRSSM